VDKSNKNIELLPFDALEELHQQGELTQYAEEKNQEFIAQCPQKGERSQRSNTLAFALQAIRSKYLTGLKAYLEINKLLQTSHSEFKDRIHAIVRGRPLPRATEGTARILTFPSKHVSSE